MAAQFRAGETTVALLESGADPLHWLAAGTHDDAAVASCLLRAGADPDMKDTSGATALDDLRAMGKKALVVVLQAPRS
jgi:ankyrin repeat protein